MTPLVSKIAVISKNEISWLSEMDTASYQIDTMSFVDNDFSFMAQNQYHLLLLSDEHTQFQAEELITEINRSQPLVSIIVLTKNSDPDYALKLIELGAEDVFNINENGQYLLRRLNLVIKRNHAKRMSMRHSRNLNSVTVLSRRLHNANNPNNLIIDVLDVVSSTFDLMGLVIVLESGSQFHLRAGNSSATLNRRVYDVMLQLHPYNPICQSIEKGIVMVFEDLSLSQYMVDIPIFDHFESAIIVPLRYGNITLGALMALGTESNVLTRDDIVIYEHLATHLGSAYQNVRHSYTQDVSAKTSLHLLRTWQHLSKVYTSAEVDETLRILASEITGVKHSLVWLYSETATQPIISASNSESLRVFRHLYSTEIINDYLNQFDTQLHPLIVWLGGSNTRNIGDLFQAMEGQQLIFVPIKDEASLLGCILVSSNSNEQMSPEYISLLEGIAHAAGQTLARNMLISFKDRQTERLEAITRSIKDGVFFVAERQDVVFCNPQFTELTGISPSLVLNKPIQSLLDELANHSDNANQTRQQLDNAVQQISIDILDQEYPIVEINIPTIDSHLYVEFIALEVDKDTDQQSWIGVLRSDEHIGSNSSELAPSIMKSMIKHVQTNAQDIYRDLISLDNSEVNLQQNIAFQQIKRRSQEIDQLLSDIQDLIQLNQTEVLSLTWNDPNKLLSNILNKPPLLQHDSRLVVKTSIKGTQIHIDRQYIMQTLTSLIEVALYLSDDNDAVQIQMGAQAKQFIFRVISKGQIITTDRINRILTSPQGAYEDIPYAVQLRLYLINQVIQKHEGQLIIKRAMSEGMQFNLLIPISDALEEHVESDEKFERIPDRKLSTVMVYDNNQNPNDVDYEFLVSCDYDLIYCDRLEQVYNEVDMVRVDVIILTARQANEAMINFVEQLRRQKNVTVPILLLSTHNTEDVRIRSLKAGVDAYIALPISNAELLAQIENLFERSKLPERVREPLSFGKLNIDFAQRQVSLDGKYLDLTRIEYELLCHLALNSGQTLTHSELLTEVWGPEYRDEKQYLWVNMSRLRRKLENTKDKTRYIFTQPGVGYILKDA